MTDLMPKIFIGSSTGGYSIAEKVKENLSTTGDCYLWKDPDVWELNRSTFENLTRMVSFFDFGVFVASSDDLTMRNDKIVLEPRDNVILEIALFLGALGRNKSFLLVEEGIALPSDFHGIYMPRFVKNSDTSIKNACNSFTKKIEEHYRLGHFSLYPTTGLAMGYFKNFVSGLVETIQVADPLEIGGITYNDFKLKVVIPKDLTGYIREKAAQFYKRHCLIENSIKTKFRKYPTWFKLDPKQAPVAVLYDMPSTLTGIDDAIELILQKDFQGRTKMQEVIEQRELNNFRRVLQMQINRSPFSLASVEIIDEF